MSRLLVNSPSNKVHRPYIVMPLKPLIKLLYSHHIAKPQDLAIGGARHALLAHLLTRVCIATCDPAFQNDHSCQICKHFCSRYPTRQIQSFAVLSILIFASEDRLLTVLLNWLQSVLIWMPTNGPPSRGNCRRRRLASEHQSSHSGRTLFEHIDSLHKGAWLSIAQVLGLSSIAPLLRAFETPYQNMLRWATA
jgi:hypothetical protein